MKTRTELVVILLSALGIGGIQWYFLKGYSVTDDFISNLVVFISIAIGFFATSLAIFATSKFSGKLYDIEDRANGGTLLHTLIKKYKNGLFFGLISIIYLLGLQIYTGGTPRPLMLGDMAAAGVLPVLAINLFYGFRLIQIVSQFVLQEAKKS